MNIAGLLDDPPRAPGQPASLWDSGLCEALFGFALMLPLLFVVQLGSGGPALAFAVTLAYAFVRRRTAGAAFARRWPLLLAAGLAIASTAWSAFPAVTLKHAIELLLTIAAGLLMSASGRPAGVLTGAWAAFGLFMVVSLALGRSVDVGSMVTGGRDADAFAGLDGVKNLFGLTAALSVLMSVFVIARALRTRAFLALAAAGVVILIEIYLAFAARSAGAVIALFLALAAFAVTASLGLVPARGRTLACAFLALLLGAAGALGYSFAGRVTATTLNLFHKDPTLTGRAYLWYRAGDMIRDKPWLGHGFSGFWVPGNVDAEGLWTYGGITAQSGFNFHNTLIELLITYGVIGAAFMIGLFLVVFVRLIWRTIREPSLTSAFYVAFVVFQLARTPFESLIPTDVDFATVLMFAALGFGFRPLEQRAPATFRPARRVVVEPWRRRLQPRPRRPIWSEDEPQTAP